MDSSINTYEWTTVTYKKKRNIKNIEKQVPSATNQTDYVDTWNRELSTPLKYKCKKIVYE
jgi:hypothetical protein